MPNHYIEQRLSVLPQFNRLNAEQIRQLADITQMLRFTAGELIFRQNDPARGMYYIAQGRAAIVQVDPATRQPRELGVVQANQYLNDAALVRSSRESAALRALEDTLVLLIPRDALVMLLARRPDMRSAIPLPIEGIPQNQPPPNPPGYQQQPPGYDQPPGYQQQPPGYQQQPPGYQQQPPGYQQQPPGYDQPPGYQPPPGYQQQPSSQPEQPATPDSPHLGPIEVPGNPIEPVKVFRSQRDDETVLLDTRRHWWAIVVQLWVPALLVIPLILLSMLGLPIGILFAIDGLGAIIILAIGIYYYLEWRNDHLIVTDQRVVHIERTLLTLDTSISEVPLLSIQEVNADIITANPLSRVFDFGTIELKTAGDAGNIKFTIIPHPDDVQDLIFQNRERQRQFMDEEHQRAIQEEVNRVLGRADDPPPVDPSQELEPMPNTRERGILGWTKSFNRAGETVYRKHFLFWMRLVFPPTVFMIIGVVVMGVGTVTSLGPIGLAIGGVMVLVGMFWFYWADWDWRHDMYVIGSDTIRISHKRPFWLQNEQDQVLLDRVDNVISVKAGLPQNLFNYGNVKIFLLGGNPDEAKTFRYVPNPQDVQAEITRRQDRRRREQKLLEEKRRREEIAEYLTVYHRETGTPAEQPLDPYQQPAQQPPAWNQQPPNPPYPGSGGYNPPDRR